MVRMVAPSFTSPAIAGRSREDVLGAPYRIRDSADRGRDIHRAIILGQLPSREDRRGDQEHPLAAFIHSGRLSYSCFVRCRLHTDRGLISEIIQQRYAASDDRF